MCTECMEYNSMDEFNYFESGNLEYEIEQFFRNAGSKKVLKIGTVDGSYYSKYGVRDLHLGLRRIRSAIELLNSRYPVYERLRVKLHNGHYILYKD